MLWSALYPHLQIQNRADISFCGKKYTTQNVQNIITISKHTQNICFGKGCLSLVTDRLTNKGLTGMDSRNVEKN